MWLEKFTMGSNIVEKKNIKIVDATPKENLLSIWDMKVKLS